MKEELSLIDRKSVAGFVDPVFFADLILFLNQKKKEIIFSEQALKPI